MKKFAFLVVLITVAFVSNTQQTTFILMRHAEKVQDGSKDPALTKEGEERSIKLKGLLASQDITAVYSTPYVRTKSTVQPTAESHDLTVVEYKPMQEEFLKGLLEKHSGGTIVIVGHSNTIPNLVNELLGEEKYAQLDDSDYNDLFIVTVTEIGQGKEVVISY